MRPSLSAILRLAFTEYAHFTSPIRRYPDLIVHRVLKWALDHHAEAGTDGYRQPYSKSGTRGNGPGNSDADAAQSPPSAKLMDWKTAQFMESRQGEEYEALIISVQKFGFFVELMEVFVEGLVPINRLEEKTGDRCVYRERIMRSWRYDVAANPSCGAWATKCKWWPSGLIRCGAAWSSPPSDRQ